MHPLCYRKPSPEELKDWKKKLIAYANYIDIVDNLIVIMKKVIEDKLSGTAQKVVLALSDAVSAGLISAYNMFKSAYGEVLKGKAPDFTSSIPFPPPPPFSSPSKDTDSISLFQLTWNIVKGALNVAGQKSSKLAEYLGPLDVSGDELVKDLNKYFGKPEEHPSEALRKPFPAAQPPATQQVQRGIKGVKH